MSGTRSTLVVTLTVLFLAGCAAPEPVHDQKVETDMTEVEEGALLENETVNETEKERLPLYIYGTVPSGDASCTLTSPGVTDFYSHPSPYRFDRQSVVPEAWDRPWEIVVTAAGEPTTGAGDEPIRICIKWGLSGPRTTDTSGTVAPETKFVYVGADAGYEVSYTITIT